MYFFFDHITHTSGVTQMRMVPLMMFSEDPVIRQDPVYIFTVYIIHSQECAENRVAWAEELF